MVDPNNFIVDLMIKLEANGCGCVSILLLDYILIAIVKLFLQNDILVDVCEKSDLSINS